MLSAKSEWMSAMVERCAKIIDPEAFGLPALDLGEFGASDRDEARMKANAVVVEFMEYLQDPKAAAKIAEFASTYRHRPPVVINS